jgi:hypothetical protein
MRPEQSYVAGPSAAHSYGLPSCFLAKSKACSAFGLGPSVPTWAPTARPAPAVPSNAACSACAMANSAALRLFNWARVA